MVFKTVLLWTKLSPIPLQLPCLSLLSTELPWVCHYTLIPRHPFWPCKQASGTTPFPKLHHLSHQLACAWWHLVLLLLLFWFVVLTCFYCRLAFLQFKIELSEFYSDRSWNLPTTLNLILALFWRISQKSNSRKKWYLFTTGVLWMDKDVISQTW